MRLSTFLPLLFFTFFIYVRNSSGKKVYKIMFYNVENLFDPENDPRPGDDEFTPQGERHWTPHKLEQKTAHLAKVIVAAGGWEKPAIVGLCEVEDRFVLEKLINHPLLKKTGYHIIHKDAPDHRGIEVAMLYRADVFAPESYSAIQIKDEAGRLIETREILHVQGYLPDGERVHFFINHWPSRYEGLMETKSKRELAATRLKEAVREVQEKEQDALIICMGDFNDQPWDDSLANILGAVNPRDSQSNDLVNLSWEWKNKPVGTLKHQQKWDIFDQFIVSKNIMEDCSAAIFSDSFLLEKDQKFTGYKPFRTYIGFRYHGGFSDHLPIIMELENL